METGKQYFLTATILNWQNVFHNDFVVNLLIKEWEHRVNLNQIKINAFVVMPNHYHIIIQFLEPSIPSDIIRDIHKWFSKGYIKYLKNNTSETKFTIKDFQVNKADRKHQIWQRNPLPILLYDREILHQKLDYIHKNPLQEKWKLANTPQEYKYSSASYYETNKDNFGFLSHIYD